MWILAKLTNNLGTIMAKLIELKDFIILHEDLDTVYNGLILMEHDKAPISMLNDYVILSITLREGAHLANLRQEIKEDSQ